MKLRDLEYLVALADHRNFHRAAEACHVSQPTLSGQIRKLEEELGTDLFERSPRNLLLTDAGRAMLAHARRALAEVEEIRQIAKSQRGEGRRLRLGVFPTLGPYLLPHVVPRFLQRFPGVELVLTEEKSGLLRSKVLEGGLDAVLLAMPVEDPRLTGREIMFERFHLAVPARHPFAARSGVAPEDLAGQRLMLLEDGHCLRDQALNLCRVWGACEVDGFRGTSLETLKQMVVAGVGVTLLPAMACRETPGMVHLPISGTGSGAGLGRRVGLFWRKTGGKADLMSALADLLADVARADALPGPAKGVAAR